MRILFGDTMRCRLADALMGLAEEAAEVMLAEDEDDDDDADDAPVALVWHSYSASSSS